MDDGTPVKKDDAGEPSVAPSAAEETLSRISKALGIEEGKDVPNLAGAVSQLKKRLDELENTPAAKTSLDEGDDAGDGKPGENESVWKGLL